MTTQQVLKDRQRRVPKYCALVLASHVSYTIQATYYNCSVQYTIHTLSKTILKFM